MRNVLKAFSFISLGGLLFGYVIGISSSVISAGQLLCHEHPPVDDATNLLQVRSIFVQLRDALDESSSYGALVSAIPGYAQCYNLGPGSRGFLTASSLIGATVASLFCFRYADGLGRKLEVQISASLYVIGALVAAASPCLWGVFAGFLIYGLGIGFAMHVGPVYIGEIAPAQIRGTLIAAKEGAVAFGILLGFLAGYSFAGVEPWGWRCMILVAAIFASIMGLGMCWIPDSPRWLALHGSDDAALLAMQFFREDGSLKEAKDEMDAIINHEHSMQNSGSSTSWTDTFHYRRPMLIGWGLVFLQQVTGQPSVLYFATTIFKAVGFGNSSAISSVGLGVVKVLASLFTVLRVDSYGRRLLLLIGIGMMTVALITIAIGMRSLNCTGDTTQHCVGDSNSIPYASSVTLAVSLMLFVGGYQVGFGPISWIMIAEVFPLQIRSSAVSVAVIINFATNIIVTAAQPVMLAHLGPSVLFSLYAMLTVASFVFVWYVVPETRGKTLEEIASELSPRKSG